MSPQMVFSQIASLVAPYLLLVFVCHFVCLFGQPSMQIIKS